MAEFNFGNFETEMVRIKGERDKTRFVVKINSLAGDTQRLKVAVRKYFLPKPYVAQDLFLKIAKDLE